MEEEHRGEPPHEVHHHQHKHHHKDHQKGKHMDGNLYHANNMGAGGAGILGNQIGLVGLVGINTLTGRDRDGHGYGAVAAAAAAALDRSDVLEQTIAILQGQNASQNAVTAAIAAVDTRLEGAIAGLGKELCNVRYENAQQTTTVLSAIGAAAQGIKDQNVQFRFGDLERELAIAQNGGPIVRAGVFKQCDPCGNDNLHSGIQQILVNLGTMTSALQQAVAAK